MTDGKPIVLIADDEPLNRHVMEDMLIDEYEVRVAANGDQALELAKIKPPPDIILLDIQMPGMDGYTVCSHLKEDEALHDIPVIFMTALNKEEDEKKGLELGANDYITKPIRASIVKARMHTHLGLKRAHEALAERNAELERMLRLRETVEEISRHDLKTPLTGILGVSQLLLHEDYIEEEHHELLSMQRAAGYNMLEMINRSMDMLKMEMGTYELNPQPVELLKVTQRIMSEVPHDAFILLLNGDSVTCNCDQFISIRGEELLFYSMLSNLIKNAAEASQPQDIITISYEQAPTQAIIQVHNVKRVPPEIEEHFFDKYVTNGKQTGTGLGTYSAKLIAETLGGTIHMQTNEDNGTVITITFPQPAPSTTF